MNNFFANLLILVLLFWAASMALFGVNLKEWFGWIQVSSGFVLGLLMGHNLAERLIAGVFFAAITMLIGPIRRKRLHP